MTTTEILKKHKTNKQGLTQKEAEERLRKYGKNEITAKKKKNWIMEFLKEFKDLMVIILVLAATLAFFLGEETDGTIIMGIVVLNALIGFAQKYRAEKAIEALKKLVSPHAVVIRDGEKKRINADHVVPGDILFINEGDTIAADATLIESNSLYVLEAVLTGESVPQEKKCSSVKNGQVFMSTQATAGTALAVVTGTGMKTEFGKIADLTATTKKDLTPLQKELIGIGVFVGKITLVISTILVLVGVFIQGEKFVDSLLFAVSVAVAAVPEGLPATITIALALGVQKLAKKNAIVKALASTETLGATTIICSDKTGTLTKNQMTVRQVRGLDFEMHVSGEGYEPTGNISISDKGKKNHSTELDLLARSCILANNASIKKGRKSYQAIGDPTEAALLVFAEKAGQKKKTAENNFKRLHEYPFSSERKIMSTIDKDCKSKKLFLHSKGAPEKILERCTHVYKGGKVSKITKKDLEIILTKNKEMASEALRVLAVAYKPLKEKNNFNEEKDESGLIFLGLAGMIDPPRGNVKQAIKLTKEAGIKTYMVTGDFSITAEAIAKKIGLTEKDNNQTIITGDELEKISPSQLGKLLKDKKKNYIFARVSPAHKLKIVSALKKNGEIVAVTGDGVNDAPALKRADIGVAMGITGTDVSKEAANLILADDSFATIVTAIKEGRTIYNNMRKFIYYIFSANIGELVAIFAAIILAIPMPLTAILILLINVGTDVLPALAIGFDPAEPDIMKKKPRPVKSKILNKQFVTNFFLIGSYIGLAVVGGYIYILTQEGWSIKDGFNISEELHLQGTTFAFALLVIIQMFHAFNSRSLKHSIFKLGIFSNKHLWGAVIISILFTITVTEVPFLQSYLKTHSLSLNQWIAVIVIASSVVLVEEIKKMALRSQNE